MLRRATPRASVGKGSRSKAVILIGFMGAGKSSVGRALAAALGWEFEDLDDRIERREGRIIAEIFREFGEQAFRESEHAALEELLKELGSRQKVIALGGGAFVQASNAAVIEASQIPTVFLDAEVEELWQRCTRQQAQAGTERPLLGNQERFRNLYEERRPHYMKASFRQDTGGKVVEQIVTELMDALKLKRKREQSRGDKL